jgi:hypothetical protein
MKEDVGQRGSEVAWCEARATGTEGNARSPKSRTWSPAGSELWGQGELSPSAELAASAWRGRIAKASGRKVKRALEETAGHIRPQADTTAWRQAMRVAGLRAPYVVTGDLAATLTQAIRTDHDLGQVASDVLAAKLFAHPITRELVVFALSDSALALRRSAGTA